MGRFGRKIRQADRRLHMIRYAEHATDYQCNSCGQHYVHIELVPEGDEPHGAPEEFAWCWECDGELARVPS